MESLEGLYSFACSFRSLITFLIYGTRGAFISPNAFGVYFLCCLTEGWLLGCYSGFVAVDIIDGTPLGHYILIDVIDFFSL